MEDGAPFAGGEYDRRLASLHAPAGNGGEQMTFLFEPTDDLDAVAKIAASPESYRGAADDGCGAREDFEASPLWAYLIAKKEDGEVVACFALRQETSTTVQFHSAFLRSVWGDTAAILSAMFDWIWANTKYLRATSRVPVFNKLALRLAGKCGMVEYGRDEKSFQKDGTLYDETLVGIMKPGIA